MSDAHELLGLAPGASRVLVRRAWTEKRRLYDPVSTATHGLLTDEERASLLQQLDDAYRRLTGEDPPLEPGAVAPEPPPPPSAAETRAPPGEEPPRDTTGAHIAYHRRRRGWSIDQVARKTKIRPPILEALEEERSGELPADAYVRGYVVQVAGALGLDDPADLARRYLERVRSGPIE